MKNFTRVYTNTKSKLNIKGFLALFVLLLSMQTSWGQLFQQQFGTALANTSNTTLTTGTYCAASPTNTQFTGFNSSGTGSVFSVASNKLTIAKSANAWGFVRGVAFTGPPTSLMVRFDYSNSASAGAYPSAVVFGVGSGTTMGTANSSITAADSHTRISFNTTANAGEFVVRDFAGSANGATTYSGTQTILLVINNSGATLTYKAPDGTYETVANDKSDVWVGTSKQLNEIAASGATRNLSYFKCITGTTTNTVNFSNMLMDPIQTTPTSSAATSVSATGFTANWAAVTGATGYRLDVSTASDFSSLVSGYSDLYVSGQATATKAVTGLNGGTPYYYRVRAVGQYTVGEFASGNSDSQNPTTTSSGTPSLAITANTTASFGSVCTNASPVTKTYTITNTGTAASNVVVTSSNAEYVVGALSSTSVSATNGTVTFDVTYTPSSGSTGTTLTSKYSTSIASGTLALTGTAVSPITQAVSTSAATPVVNTTATLKGNYTTTGVCPATSEKGFVYAVKSTNADPLVSGTGVTQGTVTLGSTGTYLLAVTGLTPATIYTYKAYVYNGTTYTYGTATDFTTLAAATKLVFSVAPPTTGSVGTNLTSFTVQAQRADNSVDTEYVANIVIGSTAVSGSGALTGTTVAATAGVASFATAQFDGAGTYTITASSGSLTGATAGSNTVISLVATAMASWDFSASTMTGPAPTATANANVIVGTLTRGSGITTTDTAYTREWGGGGLTTSTTVAAAVTAGSYLSFTIKPKTNYVVSFNNIPAYQLYSSTTGPAKAQWQYSINGTNFTSITDLILTNGGASTYSLINLSTITELQNVPATTTVTFRIVAYNTSGSGTPTFAFFDGTNSTAVDFSVNGYVTAAVVNYTVAFDANTGSGTAMTSQTITSGASANLTTNTYTKTGYTFAGWNTLSTGLGTSYADGASYTMGSANATLYAKWTANTNTITFDGNGFTGGSTTSQNIATAASANLTANGYTRTGYTFAGWATTSSGVVTYADGASYTMGTDSAVTLYAKWTANNNTITFDANGGAGTAMSNQTIATAASANLTSNSYTKAGYAFAGWATSALGTVAYADGASYTMGTGSTVTLYAKWTPTYTVTYDANGATGGSVPTDSGAYLSGATVTVASNSGSLVNSGFTFSGWNTASDGTGTTYAATGLITFTISGNTTLYAKWISASSATCPSATAVTPASAQTICQSTTAATLTAEITTTGSNGIPSYSYQWYYNTTNSYTVSGAALIVGATASTYVPATSGSEVGDRYYFCVGYATTNTCNQTNADSSLASNTVKVTVTAAPNAGIVSGTQGVCVSGLTTFSTNGTSGGSWTSGTTSVATVNSSTGEITGVAAGTSIITYTVTGTGGCANATATRTVTVTASPNAGTITGTQGICVSGLTTFSTNGTSGGSWTSGTTPVATVNSSSGEVAGVAGGTSIITYTVTGTGGCANATATRTVTVTAAPTTSNAGSAQTICSASTTTLAANTPSVGTGAWTVSGPSTLTTQFSSVSSPTAVFNPAAGEGTYTLTWTISNGACASSTSTVVITVNAITTAPTGTAAQSFCSGATVASLAATGSGILWYASATPGGSALATSTALVTGTHYYGSQTLNGCESTSRFDVTATVSAAATFGTVSTLSTSGVSHLVISQVYGGGGTAYRYDFIEIFNPTNATVNLSGYTVQYQTQASTTWTKIATLTGTIDAGKYYLIHQQDGTSGTVATITADLTGINALSSTQGKMALVNSTNVITSCTDPLIVDKVGYGSTSAVCNETSNASAPSSSTAIFRASNGCTDTNDNSADFTAVTPNPRNSATAANVCSGGTASSVETICSGTIPSAMSVSGAAGAASFTYQWYSKPGLVTPSGSDTTDWTSLGTTDAANTATYTPTTGITATTTYAVLVTPITCGTATWASGYRQVTVVVAPGVIAAGQAICSGNTPAAFTSTTAAVSTATITYQWESSTDNFATAGSAIASTNSTTYTPGSLTTTTYYRRKATSTVNSVTCSAYSNILTVTVNPLPTITGVATATAVCFNASSQTTTLAYTTTTNTPTSYTVTWNAAAVSAGLVSVAEVTNTFASGTGTISLDIPAGLAAATYTGSLTVKNANSCTSTASSFTLLVNPTSVGGSITTGKTQTICSETAPVSLAITGYTGTVVRWEKSATTDFASATTISSTAYTLPSATIGNLSTTTYIRAVVQSGNCTAVNSSDYATITVNALPTNSLAGSAQTICSGNTATLAANTPSVGTGAWTVTGTSTLSSQFSSTTDPLAVFTPAVAGAGSYTLTWTTTNLTCTSTSTAVITVNATSVGGTVSADQTICSGNTPTSVTLSGSVGTITKWQSSTDAAFTSPSDIVNTTTTLTAANMGALTATKYYRAIVQSGVCTVAYSATATKTVNPLHTISLSSGSSTQTVCINATAITNIVYAVGGGATGAGVSGLPTGVTGSFSGGNFTISGTPSASGTFNYTVTTTGNTCTAVTGTGTITVSHASVGGTIAGTATVCSGTNSTGLTLSGNTGSVSKWQSSTDAAFTSPVDITNTTTSLTATNLTGTKYYRAVVQSGVCTVAYSATATITVNAAPSTAAAGSAQSICSGNTATLAATAPTVGTGAWTVTSGPSSSTAQFNSTTNPAAVFTPTNGVAGTYVLAWTVSNSPCTASTASVTITVNDLPNTVSVSPATATVCEGGITTLTASGGTSSVTSNGPTTVSSGSITVAVPDNSATGAVSNLTVSGIPAGATITGVSINYNITHAYTSDLIINLKAPNNKVLNIWKNTTVASGSVYANFINTIASSASSTAFSTANPPYTGTFAADAINTITASSGIASNVTSWSGLYTTPNGTWTMSLRDSVNLDSGTLTSWSITINWTNTTATANPFTWTPIEGLYTDSGATTTPYTSGTSATTIYAKPSSNQTYTATATNAAGCTATATSAITVNPTSVAGTPAGDTTICTGNTAIVSLSGHTGTIQWQQSLNGTSDWANVSGGSGETTASYTTPNLSATTYYRAVVTSGACSSATTNQVIITVNTSVAGTVGGSTAICSGSTSGVLTLTGNTGSVVRWESAVSPFTSWTTISNTATTYTSGVLSQTTEFRAVVNNNSCGEVNSTPITVSIETATYDGSAWTNGPPTSTKAVVFTGNYTIGADFNACSIQVTNNAAVTVSSNYNVYLNGAISVATGSSFTMNNNTNLIQTDASSVNTGNIIVKRESAKIVRLDHTLWSSPVTGQNLYGFSSATLTNRFYTYNTVTNLYDSSSINANTQFSPAYGFAIRAPNTYQASPAVEWTGTFTGVPNNGTKTFPLAYVSDTYDINLVGNPYPSAINAATFYSGNSTAIFGTFYFYQHTLAMNSNGLFPEGTNYATWTSSGGGTAATTGNTPSIAVAPSGIIEVGQGFMVRSKAAVNLTFNNNMRVANNANQFIKSSSTVTTLEKHRMWLNLESATGSDLNQILVGYVTGATEGVDDGYDGLAYGGNGSSIYTPIDSYNYVIQCRSLPFNNTDEVPLGFNCATAGTYTIKLSSVDGLFDGNQDIFIRDNLNGTDTNIKVAPFTFTSVAGTFDNRFKIVYTQALGVPSNTFNENSVIVYKNTDWFHVSTKGISMKDILVYDVSGRLIYKLNDLNDTTAVLKGLTTTKQVLFLKITSTENQSVTIKVLN